MEFIYEGEIVSNDLFDGPNKTKVVKSGLKWKTDPDSYTTHTTYIPGAIALGTKFHVIVTDDVLAEIQPQAEPEAE